MRFLRSLRRPRRAVQGLCLLLILALALGGLPGRVVRAAGQASLSLMASPPTILADGKSTTVLTATVRDGGGSLTDGTLVRFETNLGILDKDTATTAGGVARVTLTSAATAGLAVVRASSFAGSGGSASSQIQVTFTDDRDEVYASGESSWIHMDCPGDLAYSADHKVVEAHGHKGKQAAHLQYRSLDLVADDLQVDLQTQWVLARNATLQRARHTVHALQLHYSLSGSRGTAVVENAQGVTQTVSVAGPALQTERESPELAQADLEGNVYRFADISDSRVVITARSLAVNPSQQLQFRHATIYSDQKKVLSMPYHVLPMNDSSAGSLFGQQLVGFGSQGVYLNIPYYYNVSTHSLGTIYLRNSAVSSSSLSSGITSGASVSQFGTHPGLGLDLEQSYDMGRTGSGGLIVSGLTRSDWSAHWNHTQHLDPVTSGYFLIDYPAHRSLYASSNLTRQFSGFTLNLSATGSRDPGFDGYSSSSTILNTYLQTTPRQIGQTGINMVTNLSLQNGQYTSTAPDANTGQSVKQVVPISTQSLDFRFYTAPFHPDRHTNITNSLSMGQSLGEGRIAPNVVANLGLTRSNFAHGNLSLNYTYRYDPLLSQASEQINAANQLSNLYYGSTQQRLSLNYSGLLLKKLNFTSSASYGLPLRDTGLVTTLSYRVNNDWGLGLTSELERYAGASFQASEISVARRLFGRDLVFYYSTQTKKVRFDLAASAF